LAWSSAWISPLTLCAKTFTSFTTDWQCKCLTARQRGA
jgi:hypothetical protein